MNGFAGLKMPKKQRQGAKELKELAQSLWKECTDPVAGKGAAIVSN